MLELATGFFSLCALLGFSFYRKYQARLRHESLDTMRYIRIADYYGRPMPLAFEYHYQDSEPASRIEADIDEIYHYGRDYFLKGRAPGGKRAQVFKWSRIANPRTRVTGIDSDSLARLYAAVEGSRAAA